MMTDNEIIKAFECCIDCKCKECTCYKNIDGEMRCTEIDEEEILDLINRQKAEVERLKAESQMADGYADALIGRTKSEAIKEFAERYEKEVLSLLTSATLDKKDGIYACLNILTEMVGETE